MKKRGFTIVELLIVIVVIAILAAITIVAYNGIQTRAQMSKTTNAVSAYLKGLELFKYDKGAYPNSATVPGISSYNCLGEDNPNDRCADGSTSYVENIALNTAMKSVMGQSLPMAGTYGSVPGGVVYIFAETVPAPSFWSYDNKPTNWLIYYTTGNSVPCPIGKVATYTGTTFTSATPANGQTVAASGSTPPQCWIPITN